MRKAPAASSNDSSTTFDGRKAAIIQERVSVLHRIPAMQKLSIDSANLHRRKSRKDVVHLAGALYRLLELASLCNGFEAKGRCREERQKKHEIAPASS